MCFDTRASCTYHARAMGNALHERRALAKLASRGQVIEFAENIGNFPVLAATIENDLAALDANDTPAHWRDTPVSGRIEFGHDAAVGKEPVVSGSVSVIIDAVCQRCLSPFKLPLSTNFRYALVVPGSSASYAEAVEAWELDEDMVLPADIVQEVLTMAMPFSAMHEAGDDCVPTPEVAEKNAQTTRPFAALKEQMEQEEN